MHLSKRHASFDTLAGGHPANNFKMKQSSNNNVNKPTSLIASLGTLIEKQNPNMPAMKSSRALDSQGYSQINMGVDKSRLVASVGKHHASINSSFEEQNIANQQIKQSRFKPLVASGHHQHMNSGSNLMRDY